MSGRLVGTAAALVLAAGAASAATLYECRFTTGSQQGNWIGKDVLVRHDPSTDSVTVIDGVIQAYNGRPIDGRKADETKARITFAWDLSAKDSRNQSFTMRYRLTHYRNGQPAKISARPSGFDNAFSAEGRCRLGQG